MLTWTPVHVQHSAFGNWFPGVKPLIIQAMAKIMKVSLETLKRRSPKLWTQLDPYSPNSHTSRSSSHPHVAMRA